MAHRIRTLLPLAAGLATAFAVAPARAQTMGDIISGGNNHAASPDHVAKRPSGKDLAPPNALPGTAPRADRVTPSAQSSAAMSPNDALFDAINRGDIADARDAVKRGAELDARNVLGLTPIDLSVDLSRNDITMFLLSLHGAEKPLKVVATSAPDKPGKAVHAAAAHPAAPHLAAATRQAAADPPARRQMVSADPGTPDPRVGFLGFGGAPRP